MCAHFDGRLDRGALPARFECGPQHGGGFRLPDQRRRRQSRAGHRRIGTVDHHCNLRRLALLDAAAIIGRNNQSGLRSPGIDQLPNRRHRIHVEIEAKIIGRAVRRQQFARRRRAILIEDRQRHVAHVVRRRVTQQKQHHDRHDEHDQQRARVADDLDKFLADQRQQTRVDHGSTFRLTL
jgi:hypothetical protein